MSEVFTFSQGTLSHLGDDDGFGQPAVKVFEVLKRWYHEEDKKGAFSDRHKGPGPLGLAWNEMDWHSVRKYLDLSYFKRMMCTDIPGSSLAKDLHCCSNRRLWIVQEAALAVHTTFHCNSTQLDCGAFVAAASALNQSLSTYFLHKVVKAGQSEVASIIVTLFFGLGALVC